MPEEAHSRKAVWLAGVFSIGLAILTGVLVWQGASPALPAPANRPIVAQEANYVTSNSCRACHPGNYASWHTSFHRTMTQVATPATLIPDAHNIELSFAGRQYKLSRKDDKAWVSSR